MNQDRKPNVKKYTLTILVFFLFFLLLEGVNSLTGTHADRVLRESTETVLAKWNIASPVLGKAVSFPNAGWNFSHVYEAKIKNRTSGLIFIVRLTGNSGPVTGVFYHTDAAGTVFCGLAGLPDAPPELYGITPRIRDYWIRTVEKIARTRTTKEGKK